MPATLALIVLLSAHQLAGPAGRHQPRSWYRFEDPSDLLKDSAQAALHLAAKGQATPVAKTQGDGGLVGGWMQLDGCGENWNQSLVANASQLPRQCTGSGRYCNPNFGCPGQPGGKKGGCCCNVTNDPQGQVTGVTIEFLIKLGRCAKLNGNLTLFDTGGGRYGGGSRLWVDLSRHDFSFRMEANRGDKALVQARLNGTGRASTQYLHDGEWHHVVVRRSTGGLTGVGKLDAWIDGQTPLSVDQWFSRPAPNPRPATYPWSLSGIKPGGYFAQWTDGVWPSLMMLPTSFDGGIDEVALYEEALPDELILQHYSDAMAHKPYTFNMVSATPPQQTPPPDPKPSLDPKEYPPGTLLPTPACTDCGMPHCAEMSTPGVKLSPLAQLQSYPLPRYQSPPKGSYALQKLGNCMESGYLGGENQANTSVINMPCEFTCNKTTHVCNGSISECQHNATMKIKYELGSRWNYLLVGGPCENLTDPYCGWIKPRACRGPQAAKLGFTCKSETLQTIEMVNDNPDMGLEYYFRRGNAKDKEIGSLNNGFTSNCGGNQSMRDSCYLQNASGHFIDFAGKGANCSGCTSKCKQPRLLVADSTRAKYCPDALFAHDSDALRATMSAYSKLLKKPVVRTWNDGEQFNLGSEGVFAGFEMDPVMIEDYNASGVTSRYGPDCHDVAGHHENATLCRDWFSHTSAWRAGFAARWRDAWLQPSPRTKYGEYLIAGTQSGTGNWTYMRQIMTPESVDGQRTGRLGAMRYSKASIYPGASGPGGYDTGWMGGLDDLEMYIPSQIEAGDELFSPFVAAGWKSAVEANMRPAQWLGFLKIMTALGAEYVETGFFTPLVFNAKWKNVQLPQNYVWQAAAPAYAQATLSLWSELLFDGHLVDAAPADGGMPSPAVAESCGFKGCGMQTKEPGQSWWYPELLKQYWPRPTTYRFWGGHGQDLVIMARKHETRDQYVIIGTIQPQSNVVGNTPLNVTASIVLEGVQLNFTVRRQGSTYLYSPATAAAEDNSARKHSAPPSFVQLDGWHEASHFSWWSNAFVLEAELHAKFQPADALPPPSVGSRSVAAAVRTEVPGWQPADVSSRSFDLTNARAFVTLDSEARNGNNEPFSFAYEVEPRSISRNTAHEVYMAVRVYRVELVIRRAAGERGCVAVDLDSSRTSTSVESHDRVRIGTACVESNDDFERVQIDGVVQLATAVTHRLTLVGEVGSVDIDQLRLIFVGSPASPTLKTDDATGNSVMQREMLNNKSTAARKRLFVHYDYYQDGHQVDKFSNHTLELLVPGAENVIASWSGGPAYATQWAAAGGVFAWVMPRANRYYSLEAHLGLGNFSFGVESAVNYVKSFLTPKPPKQVADFQYVALDELGIMPIEWRDGGNMSARFVGFLERLAEEGLDKRLITYVNAYNMGNGSAEIGQYSNILRACVKHCCAIGLEVYLYTQYVLKPGPEPIGKCFHNRSCLTSLARDFEAVAPGLNEIAFTTLGVSDVYLQNATALCDPTHGALRLQVQELVRDKLTATQQGLGTYTLMAAHFRQGAQASCLRELENNWPQ